MKKFLLYILFVISGVVLLDISYRLVCSCYFESPRPSSRIAKMYGFVSVKDSCDLAIVGASRANHHYSVSQIEDSLSITCYNYGCDGAAILFNYLCLLRAIENSGSKLKCVLFDLSPGQIGKEWIDESISNLYPYYWKNDSLRNIVNEVKGMDLSILMISALYQYNSQIFNMMMKAEPSEKGYIPLRYTGKPAPHERDLFKNGRHESFYSDLGSKYLDRMASVCKDNGIRFIVITSPYLSIAKKDIIVMRDMCKSHNIEYWDMSDMIKEPLMYKDYTHLNERGAKQYSDSIINKLKGIF